MIDYVFFIAGYFAIGWIIGMISVWINPSRFSSNFLHDDETDLVIAIVILWPAVATGVWAVWVMEWSIFKVKQVRDRRRP